MRRLAMLVSALCLVTASATLAAAAEPPHRIPLPHGFQPEGISLRHGRFFVGSLATGAVFEGNAETGKGSILVRGRTGRTAVGLKADRGLLWVAGGATGDAYVYDAGSGDPVATFHLTGKTTFVNDVITTTRYAWFTDSVNPVLYRVRLGADGAPASDDAVKTVPLTGDIHYQQGFNVNGIEAAPGGERLIVVQSNTGLLFEVDADSGATHEIDLRGSSVVNGDGLLLDGRRLFVVQNMNNRIAVVDLDRGLRSGSVVRRVSDPGFDIPTTLARHDDNLYVVNARFTTPPTPDTRYWVTVVPEP
jgi:sugar lactone lactonase YvrE